MRGIIVIFEYSLAVFEVMKKKIMATKDMGSMFILLKSLSENISDWKVLSNAAKKHKLSWETIKNKRSYLRPIVDREYEEQHRKKSSDFNIRNSMDALKSKFLKKFILFEGLMKRRGHSNGKSSILENFEEEVVNVSK
jgi:hypothetical protein